MSIKSLLFPDKKESIGKYTEGYGYYDRVPIRVGQFTLEKNEEGVVKFQTTCREFCDDGPKIVVTINNESGWSVDAQQGCYHWSITPSVDLHKERLERRRAFWHAGQYMSGNELTHKERFSISHQASLGSEPNLFEDDAFFKNGDAVTNDPFGYFLRDK